MKRDILQFLCLLSSMVNAKTRYFEKTEFSDSAYLKLQFQYSTLDIVLEYHYNDNPPLHYATINNSVVDGEECWEKKGTQYRYEITKDRVPENMSSESMRNNFLRSTFFRDFIELLNRKTNEVAQDVAEEEEEEESQEEKEDLSTTETKSSSEDEEESQEEKEDLSTTETKSSSEDEEESQEEKEDLSTTETKSSSEDEEGYSSEVTEAVDPNSNDREQDQDDLFYKEQLNNVDETEDNSDFEDNDEMTGENSEALVTTGESTGTYVLSLDGDKGAFAFASVYLEAVMQYSREYLKIRAPFIYNDDAYNKYYLNELKQANLLYHWSGDKPFKAEHQKYPKDLPLLMLFLFSKENRKTLQPDIRDVVQSMKKSIVLQWNDQSEIFNVNNLKVTLTEDGERMALLLLGLLWYVEQSKKGSTFDALELRATENNTKKGDIIKAKRSSTLYKILAIKNNSWLLESQLTKKQSYQSFKNNFVIINDLEAEMKKTPNTLKAYELLCDKQEDFFFKQLQSYSFPYVFDSWDLTRGFPKVLPLKAQSLRTLSLTSSKEGGGFECDACEEGTEIYYGRSIGLTPTERDPDLGNSTGLCVKTLESVLKDLGITSEEMKNSWFKNFIGTWEQADRRLKVFRETQKNLNDRGSSAALNFVDYYSNLLVLEVDAFIKKMIGYSNATNDEDILKIISGGLKNLGWDTMKQAYTKVIDIVKSVFSLDKNKLFNEISNAITGTLKKSLKTVKTVGKFLLNIAWKVATLLIKSPVFMEMAIAYFREVASDVCTQLLAKSDSSKVDILKTDGDLVKRLFLEDGKWKSLPLKEKQEVATKRNNIWAAALEGKGRLLLNILTEMLGNGAYKDTLQSFQDVYLNGAGGALAMLIEAMKPIPILGAFVEKVGVEKIKLIVTAHLSMAGKSVIKSMVRVNSSLNRVMRLYTSFFYGQSSLCGGGKFTIIDGAFDSVLRARFSAAFHTAMYNAPYYALMIAIEYAQNYAEKRNVNKSATLDLLTEQLIQNLYVSGSAQEQQKENQNSPFQFTEKEKSGNKDSKKKNNYAQAIMVVGAAAAVVIAAKILVSAGLVAAGGAYLNKGIKFVGNNMFQLGNKVFEYTSWTKDEFVKYMKGPFQSFMKGVYEEGVKQLNDLVEKYGWQTLIGNLVKHIATAYFLKKMYESIQESDGFWKAWEYSKRNIALLSDFWNGSNGAYYQSSVLPIWMVLNENKQHNIVFRMRMKELISKFLKPIIINLGAPPSENLYKEMKTIIEAKKSIKVNFEKIKYESASAKWLNVEEIIKFFKPYGSAITFFDFTVKEERANANMEGNAKAFYNDVPYRPLQLEDMGRSTLKF